MSNSLPRVEAVPATVPAVFVGIDWADQKHDVYWRTSNGKEGSRVIAQSPAQIEDLVAFLRDLAQGGTVAVALEKSRGPLLYALMFREGLELYPIDPKQSAAYRESFSSGGAKADPSDAALLCRLLRERYGALRAIVLDDGPTRRLAHLCQARRQLVDESTRLKLQLQAHLKVYFPLLLELGEVDSPLVLAILRKWTDPREFRRLHPKTLATLFRRHGVRNEEKLQALVEQVRTTPLLVNDDPLIEAQGFRVATIAGQLQPVLQGVAELTAAIAQAYAAHPDAHLLEQVPGAGASLAPRLLAAFGSDRERYATADEVATLSGIAPVTKQSGKTKIVVRRRACPRFLKQTFHEFADAARKWCPWSKAYYRWQRSKNMGHHAALRKLAKRWIRILYRVWKSRTSYDPQRHLQRLRDTRHPLLAFLEAPALQTP